MQGTEGIMLSMVLQTFRPKADLHTLPITHSVPCNPQDPNKNNLAKYCSARLSSIQTRTTMLSIAFFATTAHAIQTQSIMLRIA